MPYPLIKFVDSPDTAAAVRLDLNQDNAWPAADDFDLGAPALLGDPDGVGSAYGNRTIRLTWVVEGNKPAALNLQSLLAREVMREGGSWLLFQLTPTSQPVWFRTKRSNPGAVSLSQVYTTSDTVPADSWRVSVQLEAEPFAYGPQETFTVTTANDPASAGGLGVALPTIKGDAPSLLALASTNLADYRRGYLALSNASGIATSITNFNSTGGVSTAVAQASGGSAYRFSVGTTPIPVFDHQSLDFPALGAWAHLFVRLIKNAAVTYTVTLQVNGEQVHAQALTAALTGPVLVDLGVVPTAVIDGLDDVTTTNTDYISIYVSTPSSTTVDVDYVFAVAADRFGRWTFDQYTGVSENFLVHGDAEVATGGWYHAGAAFEVQGPSTMRAAWVGGMPYVKPGESNYLWAARCGLPSPLGSDFPHPLSSAITWEGTYHPRWLYLAAS